MAPGSDDSSASGGSGVSGEPDDGRSTRRRVEGPDEARHTRPISLPELPTAPLARKPYLIVLAGPRVGEVIDG